jgi:hypothetical protein
MDIASTTIKFFLLSSSINPRFMNIVRAPIESDQTENRKQKSQRKRETDTTTQDPRKSNKIDQQLRMTSHAQRMTVSSIRGRRRRRLGPSECVQCMKWV